MTAPLFATTPDAIRVVIPGDPVPQGRGRIVRGAIINGQPRPQIADPPKSRAWKGVAQVHMAHAMAGRAPLTGPVELFIVAVFACPVSQYRKRDPLPRRWHVGARGDFDNLQKSVGDAGNGVLWVDDRQVARSVFEKWIAAQGEPPRVEIVVKPLTGGPA